jgi:dCTP deaminase
MSSTGRPQVSNNNSAYDESPKPRVSPGLGCSSRHRRVELPFRLRRWVLLRSALLLTICAVSLLSDVSIRRRLISRSLVIDPYPLDDCFQPASIDLKLDSQFMRLKRGQVLAPGVHSGLTPQYESFDVQSMWLFSGQFMLGRTRETVELPADLAGRIEGKSSLGRIGLVVHVTAGFIDPGFKGTITLEFHNVSGCDIMLTPDMKIAQLSFAELDRSAVRPYGHSELGSHYQGQTEVQGARFS